MPVFVDSRSSLFFAPQSGEAHGLAGRPPPGNQCRGDHGDGHRQQHRRAACGVRALSSPGNRIASTLTPVAQAASARSLDRRAYNLR